LMGGNRRSHPVFGSPQAVAQLAKDPAKLIAAHPFRLELPIELLQAFAGMFAPTGFQLAHHVANQCQLSLFALEVLPNRLLADAGGPISGVQTIINHLPVCSAPLDGFPEELFFRSRSRS